MWRWCTPRQRRLEDEEREGRGAAMQALLLLPLRIYGRLLLPLLLLC